MDRITKWDYPETHNTPCQKFRSSCKHRTPTGQIVCPTATYVSCGAWLKISFVFLSAMKRFLINRYIYFSYHCPPSESWSRPTVYPITCNNQNATHSSQTQANGNHQGQYTWYTDSCQDFPWLHKQQQKMLKQIHQK